MTLYLNFPGLQKTFIFRAEFDRVYVGLVGVAANESSVAKLLTYPIIAPINNAFERVTNATVTNTQPVLLQVSMYRSMTVE